jgi:hypothetical protein
MQIASFSKLLGQFILSLVAALVPASQPFFAPAQRSDASLPAGVFVARDEHLADEDTLTVERRGPQRYRLVFADHTAQLTFDATLFQLGADREGRPAYFLDLEPRMARPQRHGIPAQARHLAVMVDWWLGPAQPAHLYLRTVRKSWLDEQEPTLKLPTARLGDLLKKAVAEDAFDARADLIAWRPWGAR